VLVRKPHAVKSGLFWFLMSASYSVVNFAVYWIPTIILKQGYDIRAASILGPFGQTCAVFAGMFVSWLMDRLGPARVLSFCYVFSAIGFFALANVMHLPVLAIVLLLFALSLLSAGISASMALTGLEPRSRALHRR
jgi:AAHS family 4-hydroxybenzoate transporter-like MFS transporter